jgi:trimeric autotransporter adhesin
MKEVHVVANAALLFLLCSALSQAQQRLASIKDNDHRAGAQIAGSVGGTGTMDYVPLWLNGTTLGNSNIFQSQAGEIGIGTISPAAELDVNGAVNAGSFNLGGSPFAFGTPTSLNTFVGFSGNPTTTARGNTADGVQALENDTTGGNNTAIGASALAIDTIGGDNTAVGLSALAGNTTGNYNTAVGVTALLSNVTGGDNTASGFYALRVSTTGNYNTASGAYALVSNTKGSSNTASGYQVLPHNTTGSNNTASGAGALFFNSTGSYNTALGYAAGPDSKSTNLTYATAIGAGAVVSQSNTLVLGGPLGSVAQVKVGIGTATPANVFTIAQGAGPAIADGWTTYSSRRWKTNIETLHDALSKVEQLRGVSYELQANGKHEVGVIAEEVGAIVPEVVTFDDNGKDARSVDYSRLTALLIEATKEQQALIEKQESQIAQLTSQVKTIQVSLKASDRANSEVRTVKADVTMVRQ